MYNLDKIDQKILLALEQHSRKPYLEIARELKVSEGTIRKRVAKLTEYKFIKRFTIDQKHNYTAIVGIETTPHVPSKEVVASLQKLKCKKIFEVTGRFDLICFLAHKNLEDINETLERIRILKGVSHTETFTILKES